MHDATQLIAAVVQLRRPKLNLRFRFGLRKQETTYAEELECMNADSILPKRSQLLSLCPFVDTVQSHAHVVSFGNLFTEEKYVNNKWAIYHHNDCHQDEHF